MVNIDILIFTDYSSFSGSLPNSHRQVKTEIMRRLMFDSIISRVTNETETKGLELLDNRPSVRSLLEMDSSDEMHRFLLTSRIIQESTITGSEQFPGEMLNPSSENILIPNSMLDLIVEYYMATYVSNEF